MSAVLRAAKLVGMFSYRDAEGRIRMPALMAARNRPR